VLTRGRFRLIALVPAVVLGLGGGAATAMTMTEEPVVIGALQIRAVDEAGAAEVGEGGSDATEAPSEGAPGPVGVAATTDGAVADLTAEPAAMLLQRVEGLVPELATAATPVPPVSAADRMAGLLSLDTPQHADGELVVVPGSSPAPDPSASVRTVRVEVEAGLPVDGERFARLVMGILNNPQGWGHGGALSFARTDGAADLRVVLASPDKIDEMCAPLATNGDFSCGRYGHAAINYTRWVTGAPEFDDLTVYRQYVVNHEVGHLLGHQHVSCPGAGEVAPVMQQQSVRVAPCLPNGWPYPDAT